jgi:hypothetical protein
MSYGSLEFRPTMNVVLEPAADPFTFTPDHSATTLRPYQSTCTAMERRR